MLHTLLRSAGNARPESTGFHTRQRRGATGPVDSAAGDGKQDLKIHAVQMLLGGHGSETMPKLMEQRLDPRLHGLCWTGRHPKLCKTDAMRKHRKSSTELIGSSKRVRLGAQRKEQHHVLGIDEVHEIRLEPFLFEIVQRRREADHVINGRADECAPMLEHPFAHRIRLVEPSRWQRLLGATRSPLRYQDELVLSEIGPNNPGSANGI